MTNPCPVSVAAVLGRVTAVDIPCRDCGAPVPRPLHLPGRPEGWRAHVRCPVHAAAAGVDPASARTASVRERDRAAWADTVRAFDVVAGYEHARIDELGSPATARVCTALVDGHTAAAPGSAHRGG
ncbi:hypothetical protein, partial [Prescottella agglutinans]